MLLRRRIAKRKDFSEANELNLVPFMDLMISIIPFLMVSAVFTAVATIDTNAPSRQSNNRISEVSLVVVVVNKDGYSIAGSGPVIKNSKNAIVLAKKGADYDTTALNNELTKLKANDPSAEDLLILAQPDVAYSNLIDVMDAARSGAKGEVLFPNAFFGGTT
jgi:biopolymer transport protein ExbD